MNTNEWTQREFAPTDISVGPWAWHVGAIADAASRGETLPPSLIVAGPDDSASVLAAAAPHLHGAPIMLIMREPRFARQFDDDLKSRLASLGVDRLAVLALWSHDPADLKSGGVMQRMAALRERGVVSHLGLVHTDVRQAEWIASHTNVRVLGMPYGLADQSARYRAIAAAHEYGMACVAMPPQPATNGDDAPPTLRLAQPQEADALRFAAGEGARALPILDRPPNAAFTPMTGDEVEARWQSWQSSHAAPAPLPRSLPPD